MHKWFLALGTERAGPETTLEANDADGDEQKAELDEECLQKIKPGGLKGRGKGEVEHLKKIGIVRSRVLQQKQHPCSKGSATLLF